MSTSKKPKPPDYVFGRPSKYTPELAQTIIDRVAEHPFGLERICHMYEDMPNESTIHAWLNKYEDFSKRYYTNREKIAHLLFHENLNELDRMKEDYYSGEYGQRCIEPSVVAARKMCIAQRNYMASKLMPSIYNGHGDTTQKDNASVNQVTDDVAKEREKEY